MRKVSTTQLTLFLSLLAVLTVLIFNCWLIAQNVYELRSQQEWVEHTHIVMSRLDDLLTRAMEAESAARGYIINRENRFFTIFENIFSAAQSDLAQIRELTVDNPVQQRAATELEDLFQKRMSVMKRVVSTFEKQHKLETETFQQGEDTMDALRRQVKAMETREMGLLEERRLKSESSYYYVRRTLIIITALSAFFALLSYALVRRHLLNQSREAAEQIREVALRAAEADSAKLASGEKSFSEMAFDLIEFIVRGLGAPGANLFTVEKESIIFEAGYAATGGPQSKTDSGRKVFRAGEGLIGSAALRDSVTEIKDVPSDYFKLTSSLGEMPPQSLAFSPIRFQGRTVGLIEVALFQCLNELQKEWLAVVARSLGIGINAALSRQAQQKLLEETQRQAEELQTQQEELRTTNEELEIQARELTASQERLQCQQVELQQINEELEHQALTLEGQRESLSDRNLALEKAQRETQAKAMELEKTSLYKSEFLAKMSHELRTPLNSLMILATLLQENRLGNLNAQQVDFAKTIFEAGGDLLTLINDILDLSKLEARKLTARPERFSTASFFAQVIQMFSPLVETKSIELKLDIHPDAPSSICTDQQRLHQIIRNLVSNAVKFTDRGSITISARGGRNNTWQIAVRDTGVGIAVEKRQLIFEAFEQADGSVSRKYGGTGLGLSIARELANLLGGQISVESESGVGSCFTLEIPVDLVTDEADESKTEPINSRAVAMVANGLGQYGTSTTAQAEVVSQTEITSQAQDVAREIVARIPNSPLQSQSPSESGKPVKTIVIIEDDKMFRSQMAEAAKSHGFHAIELNSGEIALHLLEQHIPDAILLDVGLPGISGLTVLEMIKQKPKLRHVPIHMFSGTENQQSALRMGAIGYLMKPVTIDDVRGALSRIEHVIARSVKKLLVVEDDAKQRKAIAEIIEGRDVEILTAGTGREATEILRTNLIDCVILDLSLPDCSGFELLERLNKNQEVNLPPVVIYTGQELTSADEERLRKYSDSIIIKGAKSPERLLDEVSLFLHRVETSLPSQKREMLTAGVQSERLFSGRHILVVDDDLRNVFALTSALETHGFKVHVARNGIEALEELDRNSTVDIVLMDIMMPKMDGFEAMKQIRAKPTWRKLPVIALTAKTMKGEYERCIQAGASDYLPKPINLTNLLSVLNVWLPPAGRNQ